MPSRRSYESDWIKVKTIGEGSQGAASLWKQKRTGELTVRKVTTNYEMVHDPPLEAIILQKILPPSKRIIDLVAFSFETSRDHSINLVERFEYCRGGDLDHAVTQHLGRFSEDFIWHCFIQIAEALDLLHNGGSQLVVHRDVKPDNIFLDRKYHSESPWPDLKLGDFGLAVLEEHTESIHVPCWQPPELPHLTPAGDIWSLGAIIHWLAHGRPPVTSPPTSFPGSREEWEMLPDARKPKALPRSYSSDLNEYMLDVRHFSESFFPFHSSSIHLRLEMLTPKCASAWNGIPGIELPVGTW